MPGPHPKNYSTKQLKINQQKRESKGKHKDKSKLVKHYSTSTSQDVIL